MKILDVNTFRDGGTICIDTDKGKFWLPSPLITDSCLYKGANHFKKEVEKATDEKVAELFRALAADAANFAYVKRSIR